MNYAAQLTRSVILKMEALPFAKKFYGRGKEEDAAKADESNQRDTRLGMWGYVKGILPDISYFTVFFYCLEFPFWYTPVVAVYLF